MSEPEVVNRKRTLRGAGADYFMFKGREALCEGPTRTSKSWALMMKADYTARTYPESRQLICRQTRKSLNESILKDWRDEILWVGHPAISATASREHQDVYRYPNRSEIYFTGLDTMQDTASPILSSKWDRIYVVQAEETKEEAWETLTTRLSSFKTPYHQITADCNPAAPSHWLNKRFSPQYVGDNRARFRFRHWDNPYFYTGTHPDGQWTREGKEYVSILESTLTGVRRKRFLEGQWAAADNMILDNFDPERHILTGCEIGVDPHFGWLLHAPRFGPQPIRINYFTAGLDSGWHPDPGAFSLWAYDAPRWHPKIRRFRIAEVVKLRWQKQDWADMVESLAEKYGLRWLSCDRSDPEAIAYFNLRLSKQQGRLGYKLAVKCPPIGGGHRMGRDKASQIDLMREGLGEPGKHQRTYLLDNAFIEGHDEELRRMGRPTCYEQEVESWVFKQKPGESMAEPVPDDDCDEHALDAARYDETLNFARQFGSTLKDDHAMTPEERWMKQALSDPKPKKRRRA